MHVQLHIKMFFDSHLINVNPNSNFVNTINETELKSVKESHVSFEIWKRNSIEIKETY